MSDERQQMRGTTLAWTAGIVGWVLFVAATVLAFSIRHSLHKQKATQESETAAEKVAQESKKAEWETERNALKLEKDSVESRLSEQTVALQETNTQLAPFVAIAGRLYPNAPAEVQLEQLHKRIATLLGPRTGQDARFIGRDGVARLRAMLQDGPAYDVEIGCMQGDTDSLAISEELRTAFESSGSKVRELVRYASPPIKLRGVSIHSKPKFDDVLGDIVGQIFHEVSQEKNQWVGKDEIVASKPDEPEPDIRIFVGAK